MKYLIIIFVAFLQINATMAQRANYLIHANTDSLEFYYNKLTTEFKKPGYKLFCYGLKGYNKLCTEKKVTNDRYLILIDFTLPSNERRLWVIDLYTLQITNNSLVSHGRNSGNEYALKFSNKINSHMSSLGFYTTSDTYIGKHGYSLYLDGRENGINDNARKRAIVIHSADYATWNFIKKFGRLGRSYGCPALPPQKGQKIIDTIKGGACLFIYYPDKTYLKESKYFHK